MKNIALHVLTLIFGAAIGMAVAFRAVGRYSDQVSNEEIVKSTIAQVMHARLVSEGKGETVVRMVEEMIENGLSRIDYRETYPGTESQTKLLLEEVQRIYRNQGKEVPPKVKSWIEQNAPVQPLSK